MPFSTPTGTHARAHTHHASKCLHVIALKGHWVCDGSSWRVDWCHLGCHYVVAGLCWKEDGTVHRDVVPLSLVALLRTQSGCFEMHASCRQMAKYTQAMDRFAGSLNVMKSVWNLGGGTLLICCHNGSPLHEFHPFVSFASSSSTCCTGLARQLELLIWM